MKKQCSRISMTDEFPWECFVHILMYLSCKLPDIALFRLICTNFNKKMLTHFASFCVWKTVRFSKLPDVDHLLNKVYKLNLHGSLYCNIRVFSDSQLNIMLRNLPNLVWVRLHFLGIERTDYIFHRLERIENLNLTHNRISRITGMDHLKNLKSLNLSMNNIKEIHGLDGLRNLTKLYMRQNDISTIAGELSQLKKLRFLSLCDNPINKIEGLDKLTNLRVLKLMNTCIMDPGDVVRKMTVLETFHISLSDKMLEKSIDTSILSPRSRSIIRLEPNKTIKDLRINNYGIWNVTGLRTLEKLEKLDLSKNLLSSTKGMRHLVTLRYLDLSENCFNDMRGFVYMFPFLKGLNLSKNSFCGKFIVPGTMRELEWLDLHSNNIESFDSVDRVPMLKRLNLNNNLIEHRHQDMAKIEEVLVNRRTNVFTNNKGQYTNFF